LESEFLFQSTTKQKSYEILKLVYENLKVGHSCFLSIENTLNCSKEPGKDSAIATSVMNMIPTINHFYLPLQLFKTPDLIHFINDYDVPMFTIDKIHLSHLSYDISFHHLILFIDGVSHVKKISKDINMDIHYIKKTLSLLLYYNIIILADIFKFSNIYVFNIDVLSNYTTEAAASDSTSCTVNNRVLDEIREFACLEYQVSCAPNASTGASNNNNNTNSNATTSASSELPRNIDILLFLFKLQPKKTFAQVLMDTLLADCSTDMYVLPLSDSEGNIQEKAKEEEGKTKIERNDSENYLLHLSQSNSNFQQQNKAATSPETKETQNNFSLPLKNINFQRLIAICLFKGIIRRLFEYPLYLKPTNPIINASLDSSAHGQLDTSVHSVGPNEDSTHGKQHQLPIDFSPPNISKNTLDSQNTNLNNVISTPPLSKSTPRRSITASGMQGMYPGTPGSNNGTTTSSFEPRLVNKTTLLSRGKSVLSQTYLKEPNYYTSSAPMDFQEIIYSLDGSEHMDAICCKYEVGYQDIVNTKGVQLIYK
jgi:hypothetical protein